MDYLKETCNVWLPLPVYFLDGIDKKKCWLLSTSKTKNNF